MSRSRGRAVAVSSGRRGALGRASTESAASMEIDSVPLAEGPPLTDRRASGGRGAPYGVPDGPVGSRGSSDRSRSSPDGVGRCGRQPESGHGEGTGRC